MKCCWGWPGVLAAASFVSGGETLFTEGPQEFAGRKYYWLAEWKLEVTLPVRVEPGKPLKLIVQPE